MPNKSLTIDVNTNATPTGSLDRWSALDPSGFIKNIITPQLAPGTDVGSLVSGIPSAFARVDLFKNALNFVSNDGNTEGNNNLMAYYDHLVDEWKGLIACMALDYAHISVRRIELTYSDGKNIAETTNIYEPKGAFGNMLLFRKERWCEQGDSANKGVPFINVIKYHDKVVGATAPECLLFTSSGYKCEATASRPWVDRLTGKFTEPSSASLDQNQMAALHAYICHILKGLPDAEDYYSSLKDGRGVNYTSIRSILTKWKEQIERSADTKGYNLSVNSTPPVSAAFSQPFSQLFCYKENYFGVEGVISSNNMQGSIEFDPQNLLLPASAHIAKLELNTTDITNLPLLVLTAEVKGMETKAYFALPLSAQGLNVFGRNISALVGMNSDGAIQSSLKATYDPQARTNNLEVVLTLVTDVGRRSTFKKVYTADGKIENKDILIWPNFISPQWNKYYMYSELPHNGTAGDFRAYPFVGEMQGNYFRIVVDNNNNPVLLSENGKIAVDNKVVDAELLVVNNDSIADNKYKYEIYVSNKPFKGVRLKSATGNDGGFLLINYSSAIGTQLPRDLMMPGATPTLQHVRLGIDFGSTNTSIAYSSDNTQEQGFTLESQRVSLMGNEMPDRHNIPRENQVFFFQGAGCKIPSNSIKSVLTLHDNRRLPQPKMGETLRMRNEREVIGGFPCLADNLPFLNSTEDRITLSYPNVGQVTQVHNMKWEDSDDSKAQKSAFLRTLMLQVYATLFAKGLVPDSIKWSYPSAMAGNLLLSYQTIWDTLSNISPVLDQTGAPIRLNVSRYVQGGSISPLDSRSFTNTHQDEIDPFRDGFGSSVFGSSDFSENTFGTPASVISGFDDAESSAKKESVHNDATEDFMPDDPTSPIEYDAQPIYNNNTLTSNPSLSEAEAVANFVSVTFGQQANILNLCFDVGGSTTDISALFMLNNGLSMIKQNSIRFAAQRVSSAVSHFPQFKKVLQNVCAQNGIKLVGLNFGTDTYNASTAPYFYDQVVSRLDDNQLRNFYQQIAANCPAMMVVNLYVTGLLMYYAGQLAHKLVDDLNRTPDSEWAPKVKPKVRVTFAGKGSRLYQWLDAINPNFARDYYGRMFVLGFGENHLKETLAGWQSIELPTLGNSNIKYEVSKGLAKGSTDLSKPRKHQTDEIIGEVGFELTGADGVIRPVEFTNSITSEMMREIGRRLNPGNTSAPAVKFTEFCGWFYQAARSIFGWNVNPEVLRSACQNLNIIGSVQNMPEFRAAETEARSGGVFSFVAPIIILEGMKFFEDGLLKMLQEHSV